MSQAQSIEEIRAESYAAVVARLTAGWVKIPGGWRRETPPQTPQPR